MFFASLEFEVFLKPQKDKVSICDIDNFGVILCSYSKHRDFSSGNLGQVFFSRKFCFFLEPEVEVLETKISNRRWTLVFLAVPSDRGSHVPVLLAVSSQYMMIKCCFHLMRDKRFPQSPWGRRVAFVPLQPLLRETISVWKYPETYSIWTQNITTFTSKLPLCNLLPRPG